MLIQHLPALSNKTIVLASASPRRKELLQQIGLQFRVLVSDFDELLPHERFASAADYAKETATHKAIDVTRKAADQGISADIVIAADTVVEFEGDILEKPADAADAIRVLSRLSGNTHHVHTGVALMLPKVSGVEPGDAALLHAFSESTSVQFDVLPPEAIAAYVATGEPLGKAGSYGIQGSAGSFVVGLQGCYFNVMGLPLYRLSKALVQLIEAGSLPLE